MIRSVLALGLIFFAGCADAPPTPTPAPFPATRWFTRPPAHPSPYIINSPDRIDLVCPGVEKLDHRHASVQKDGMIVFDTLGRFQLAGRNAQEAQAMLSEAARREYHIKGLVIRICAGSKHYQAYGYGIDTQGTYGFTCQETLLSALLEQGFNEKTWPRKVRLTRPGSPPYQDITVQVDFGPMIEKNQKPEDWLLEDGDIIEVTYTPFARLKMLPFSLDDFDVGNVSVRACRHWEMGE